MYIVHIIQQIVQKVVDNKLTLELYCKHAFKKFFMQYKQCMIHGVGT